MSAKAAKKITDGLNEAIAVQRKSKFARLNPKKHGVGGLILGPLKYRKQDARAKQAEMFAVVFFPKVANIGKASINGYQIHSTLAASAEHAKQRFMDRIASGEVWASYQRAGHRVRKVKITDLGDA